MARETRQQLLIAQEAARIVHEEGLDYGAAKRKAVKRMARDDPQQPLPDDEQIDRALAELNRIYIGGGAHAERLLRLRLLALRLMREHAGFSPRLAGHAGRGYVSEHSPLVLWLFADSPEQILVRLLDENLRFKHATTRIATERGQVEEFPSLRFQADATDVELVMLPNRLLKSLATRRERDDRALLDQAGIETWLRQIGQDDSTSSAVVTGARSDGAGAVNG